MFEKEAEEIANKKLCANMMCYNHCNFNSPKHHRCGDWHRCYEIAKEGIELGYNKANELHYVKNGDLPKDEDDVLCQIAKDEFVVGYYHKKNEVFYTTGGEFIKVIAWKEIVLPKEIK